MRLDELEVRFLLVIYYYGTGSPRLWAIRVWCRGYQRRVVIPLFLGIVDRFACPTVAIFVDHRIIGAIVAHTTPEFIVVVTEVAPACVV